MDAHERGRGRDHDRSLRYSKDLTVDDEYRAALAATSKAKDDIVERLIAKFPGGRGLRSAPYRELRGLGLTRAQVRRIQNAFGLADAVERVQALERRRGIRNPERAAAAIRVLCREAGHLEQESFVTLALDGRQRYLTGTVVGLGSVAQLDVHPREVFKPLVRAGAHSAVIGHNHPSGDPSPSDADLVLTRRLVEAGKLLGIPVLDHLIVTSHSHVSLAVLGLMPRG